MVQIIKTGQTQRWYTTQCRKCSCQFEFEERESSLVADPREGDARSIKCPTRGCGSICWAATATGYSRSKFATDPDPASEVPAIHGGPRP